MYQIWSSFTGGKTCRSTPRFQSSPSLKWPNALLGVCLIKSFILSLLFTDSGILITTTWSPCSTKKSPRQRQRRCWRCTTQSVSRKLLTRSAMKWTSTRKSLLLAQGKFRFFFYCINTWLLGRTKKLKISSGGTGQPCLNCNVDFGWSYRVEGYLVHKISVYLAKLIDGWKSE